jgi:CBS domain-containing protein
MNMLVSEIVRAKGNCVLTASPDDKVLDAVNTMVQHDIGSVVVIEQEQMIGLLSFREVLGAIDRRTGVLGDLRVRDLMVSDPMIANPHMNLMELRRLMVQHHTRYIPIVDGEAMLGIISFHDVARAVYEEQSFENRMLKGYVKNLPEEEAPAL